MLSPEIIKDLKSIELCQSLNDEELAILFAHSRMISFAPGELILQQGKKSDGMYIIIDGTVLVVAKILGEGITNIASLSRGNILGEISIIEEDLCATSVIANGPVRCLFIKHIYFEMLSILLPKMKYKLIVAITQQACNRLQALRNKIKKVITHSAMTKQSLFGEVIKSLKKPTIIALDDISIDIKQFKNSHLLGSNAEENYDELLRYSTVIEAPKNCTLIKDGENAAPCYIVFRGAVQSSIIEANTIAKLSVLSPMSLFCSVSLIDNHLSSIFDYTTCEHAILLEITLSNLDLIKKNNSKLWYKIYDLVCKSFVSLERAADKLDVRLNSELYNR